MLAHVQRNFIGIADDQFGRGEQHDICRHDAGGSQHRHAGNRAAERADAGEGKLVPDSINPSDEAVPGVIKKYGAVSGIPLPVNSANMSFRSATTFAAVAPVLAICSAPFVIEAGETPATAAAAGSSSARSCQRGNGGKQVRAHQTVRGRRRQPDQLICGNHDARNFIVAERDRIDAHAGYRGRLCFADPTDGLASGHAGSFICIGARR